MEEKSYPIEGTVTISAEEYRDLIRESVNNGRDANENRSKLWREEEKVKKLEKELEDIKAYKAKLMDFIKQDNERYQAYVRFTAEKSIETE